MTLQLVEALLFFHLLPLCTSPPPRFAIALLCFALLWFCFPFLITFARRRLRRCPPGAIAFFVGLHFCKCEYLCAGYKFLAHPLPSLSLPPALWHATIFYMSLLCMLSPALKTYNFLKRFPFALMSLIKFEGGAVGECV